MAKKFFITGTDTSIGKTFSTCRLLRHLQQQQLSAIGIKPLLTGSAELHTDTHALLAHNSIQLPTEIITPYSFSAPTSPHIAARQENKTLSVHEIVQACQPALQQPVDIILIEGVGGWFVPLNAIETLADLAIAFNYPVILVVGLRLGCLNHALLTAAAIQQTALPFAGWIANQMDPDFAYAEEYLQTLQTHIPAPLLASIPYQNRSATRWFADFNL